MSETDRKIYEAIAVIACVFVAVAVLAYPLATRYVLTVHEGVGVKDNGGIRYDNIVRMYKDDELVVEKHNSMTANGKTGINERLFTALSTAPYNYIAIGTGTDDGDPTNNAALVTELTRAQATYYTPGTAQWGLNYTFTFSGSYTIKEAGIFNASSGGTLAFYIGNLSVAVTSADTLKISWTGTTSGST